MQIVIDIPKEDWEFIKESDGCRFSKAIIEGVINGIPLSKHGRLIDENELIDEIEREEIDGRYYDVIYAHSIYDAPTIVEADKEDSE